MTRYRSRLPVMAMLVHSNFTACGGRVRVSGVRDCRALKISELGTKGFAFAGKLINPDNEFHPFTPSPTPKTSKS